MSKIKYDKNSPLAEYYAKTEVDGDIVSYHDDRRTYSVSYTHLTLPTSDLV